MAKDEVVAAEVPAELKIRLRVAAALGRKTMTELVKQFIAEGLDRLEPAQSEPKRRKR